MRIAIVNDSRIAVEAMRRVLAASPQHEIAWVACDGAEALAQCARDTPDLVLMDIFMPVMDGVETTRRIMQDSPCAVVVVTTDVQHSSAKVFDAMSVGALDAVNTPAWEHVHGEAAQSLLRKVDNIARLIGAASRNPRRAEPSAVVRRPPLVAIGASTGGPNALATILSRLPADLPAAVVIIQHVDAQFAANLASWLAKQCVLPVRLAGEGDTPMVGTVLLAATNDHLVLRADGTLHYTPNPADYPYRPSVDVFFDSLVEFGSRRSVAALLTGMGRDGAKGLRRLKKASWHTLAQDQASCAVYGMPKAAAELDATVEILTPEGIAEAIIRVTKKESLSSRARGTGEIGTES